MKKIYFNNNSGVHTANYQIFTCKKEDSHSKKIVLHIIQKSGDGLSLINSNFHRTQVVNTILKSELNGIQLSNIQFYFEWQSDDTDNNHCWKFELDFDPKEIPNWKEPRSTLLRLWYWLLNKEISTCWLSSDAVAGQVKVVSHFEKRQLIQNIPIEEC